MLLHEVLAATEAVLFAAGEPVVIDRICLALDMSKEEYSLLLKQLLEQYNGRPGGLLMLRLEDKLQLCTREAHAAVVRRVLSQRRKAPLSPAAMEVLAIAAYNQPVTRAYIEQVRGVDSSAVVATLLEKELLEECGTLDAPGRPTLFATSCHFLRIFGLSSLDELPDLALLQQRLQLDEAAAPQNAEQPGLPQGAQEGEGSL